eukprot:6285039-Alexandrium_andersonii.AAC.1
MLRSSKVPRSDVGHDCDNSGVSVPSVAGLCAGRWNVCGCAGTATTRCDTATVQEVGGVSRRAS